MGVERAELIRRAAAIADLQGDGLFVDTSLAPSEERTHMDHPRLAGEAATLPMQLPGPAAIQQRHPSDSMVRVAFNITAEDWEFLMASGSMDPWQQILRIGGREVHFTSGDPE